MVFRSMHIYVSKGNMRVAHRPIRCLCAIYALYQSSATSPLFSDNLHFEHFDQNVNHESRLTFWSKCSKWRLSEKRGLVADGCFVSLGKKFTRFVSQHIDRFDSIAVCDICFVTIGQKITRFVFQHIDRFDSMAVCDICFVSTGQKITKRIANRPIRFEDDVRYLLCNYWPEQSQDESRTSTDSIRGRCAICAL